MHKTLVLFLYCLFGTLGAVASTQEIEEAVQDLDTLFVNPKEVLIYDDSQVEKVTLDENKIKEFKGDEDFNYQEVVPEENVWTQFKAWLSNLWRSFINSIFGVDEAVGFWAILIELLPYIGMIILIALLVWIFTKIDSGTLLGERINAPGILLSDDEELIKNQDLESLITKALSENNYRLAIRYYYLLILQLMSNKDLINWQVQKTNNDYIFEIKDQETRDRFKKATDLYDYIWYGNFEVDETAFAKAETPFKTLKAAL